MPIPLASVTHAEVTMRGVLASGGSNAINFANVFHYRRTAVAVDPTKAALKAIFDSTVAQVYLAAANVDVGSLKIDVRWLDDADDIPEQFTAAPLAAGVVVGSREPSRLAVAMLLRTAIKGKSNRGRKHFAGSSDADSIDDVLTGAPLVLWQNLRTAVAAQLTDSTPNTWNPCVYSRKLSQPLVNPTTIITNDVTNVLLNLTLGTMNRRRVVTTR